MTPDSSPTPLLTYRAESSRVEVGAHVELLFAVSVARSVGACAVSQIVVHLPIGDADDATNLSHEAPGVSSASIAASDGSAWVPSAGPGDGVFVFRPPHSSFAMSRQSLTIRIAGIEVSPLVGTAEVAITEWAAPGDGPAPGPHDRPSGRTIQPVDKFPEGFYAFDFKPDRHWVEPGGAVTFSWAGSDNADFAIGYTGHETEPVVGRSWQSPELYDDTDFVLYASATGDGDQTVVHELPPVTVSVVSPEVKDFSADPHDVDDNQPVTLRWHTAHADKAVLTGPSLREELSPQSDKANPKTLVPKFGGRYWLRPYKGDVSGQAIELPYAFNDLEIVRFEASPPAVLVPVHAGKETTITPAPSTWLSWAVRNARSVSYAGTTIATSGPVSMGQSIAEVAAPTTYELVATYIDGTTTQRRELTVGVRRLQAAFVVDGSRSQAFVDLTLAAGAESGVRITGSYLTWPGAPRAVDLGAATLDRVGDQWRGRVAVGEWTPQRYAPSFICNYVLAGGVPTTVGNDLIVLG